MLGNNQALLLFYIVLGFSFFAGHISFSNIHNFNSFLLKRIIGLNGILIIDDKVCFK